MSTQEKLAWAKQHGITPPDYVLAAAEAESPAREPGSCCQREPEVELADAEQTGPASRSSCCTSGRVARSNPPLGGDTKDWDWLIGIQAQKCQGLSTLWLVSGAVLPPPPPVEAPADSAPPLWWSESLVCRWQGVLAPPDVPPPQACSRAFGYAS